MVVYLIFDVWENREMIRIIIDLVRFLDGFVLIIKVFVYLIVCVIVFVC